MGTTTPAAAATGANTNEVLSVVLASGGGTNLTPGCYDYFLRALDPAALFELRAAPARFFPPPDLTVRPLRPSL